jgi:hypothetical protein
VARAAVAQAEVARAAEAKLVMAVVSLEVCLEAATEAGETVVEANSPPKVREGAEVVVWTALAKVEGWAEVRAEAAWAGVGWVVAVTAAAMVVVAMEGGAKGAGATGKVPKEEETEVGVTGVEVMGVVMRGAGVTGVAGRVAGRALVESPPRSCSPSDQLRLSLGSRAPPTCRHSTVLP